MLQKKTALLGCVIALIAAAAQAELISNGSFEKPALSGDIQTGMTGASISDWTISSGAATLARGFFGEVAADGEQFLDIASGGTDLSTITQSLNTANGTAYRLTFAYNVTSNGDDGVAHLTYAVGNGVSTIVSDTINIDSAGIARLGQGTWRTVTVDFVADSTTTTVSFTSNNFAPGSGGFGACLDNVSVTVVPEPGTTMLFGVGLSGLLAYAWRKRQK